MSNNNETAVFTVPAAVAGKLKTIANNAGKSAQGARWEFLAAMQPTVIGTDASFNVLATEFATALTMGRTVVTDAGWSVIGAQSTLKAYIGMARFLTEAEAAKLAKTVGKHKMSPTTIYSKYNRLINRSTTDDTRAAFVAALAIGDTEAAAKLVPAPKPKADEPTATDDESEAGDPGETTEAASTTEPTTEAPSAPVESSGAPSLTERARSIVDRMSVAEVESLISYATEALAIKEAAESEAQAASV